MSLLKLENISANPIGVGDAGIILKEDGTFRIFNTHAHIDPENLTPAQAEQGKKLLAITIALQVPQVMDVLYDFARNPEIAGAVLDAGLLS